MVISSPMLTWRERHASLSECLYVRERHWLVCVSTNHCHQKDGTLWLAQPRPWVCPCVQGCEASGWLSWHDHKVWEECTKGCAEQHKRALLCSDGQMAQTNSVPEFALPGSHLHSTSKNCFIYTCYKYSGPNSVPQIWLVHRYLLCDCYVTDPELRGGGAAVNKTDNVPNFWTLVIPKISDQVYLL